MADSRFIIYGLTDPRTGEVRYIGKSSNGMSRPRAHGSPAMVASDGTHKGRWVREVSRAGLRCGVVVFGEFDSSELIDDHERWAIAFGRSCGWNLTNLTDGGDGQSRGYVPSDAAREKIRRALTGRPKSHEHAMKVGARHRGKTLSEETKAKIRKARACQVITAEHRAKIGAFFRGRPGKLLDFCKRGHEQRFHRYRSPQGSNYCRACMRCRKGYRPSLTVNLLESSNEG